MIRVCALYRFATFPDPAALREPLLAVAEAAGGENGAGADWGSVGAGDAGTPEPAPEEGADPGGGDEGAEVGADWAGTVSPPGTATGPQPSSRSVPPPAGSTTVSPCVTT